MEKTDSLDFKETNIIDDKLMSEIKTTIKYNCKVPDLFGKFYDVRTLLFEEITNNPNLFKTDNKSNDNINRIIKSILHSLELKYIGDKSLVCLDKEEGSLPADASDFIKNFSVLSSKTKTEIKIGNTLTCDVYLDIPRGNRITMKNLHVEDSTSFCVQNLFNSYGSEGFTLAIVTEKFSLAIQPNALSGLKGKGDIYVYFISETGAFRDLASKYFDCTAILDLYKG